MGDTGIIWLNPEVKKRYDTEMIKNNKKSGYPDKQSPQLGGGRNNFIAKIITFTTDDFFL